MRDALKMGVLRMGVLYLDGWVVTGVHSCSYLPKHFDSELPVSITLEKKKRGPLRPLF